MVVDLGDKLAAAGAQKAALDLQQPGFIGANWEPWVTGNIHRLAEVEASLTPAVLFPHFWSLIFMDVEELCYFVEIIMFLPVFDDLKERRVS